LFCWIAIPPSPAAFEPEAKRINLSATSRSVVCWKEAVPRWNRSNYVNAATFNYEV
jgi:hypothetical protein